MDFGGLPVKAGKLMAFLLRLVAKGKRSCNPKLRTAASYEKMEDFVVKMKSSILFA